MFTETLALYVFQCRRFAHVFSLIASFLVRLSLVALFLPFSAAVLGGIFDRLAAVILAGYCAITALLWKQFWNTGDFRLKGPSMGRDVFWDFLKNFAVAGGFLILATGGTAYGVKRLILHPLNSSHPYTSVPADLHVPTRHATNPPAGVSR
jgi:hypothetical protein